LTSKIHLVADGRARPLAFLLTPANVNDTSMMIETLERVRVPRLDASGGPTGGRPRTRPERVIADKGYPSRANRDYLAQRGIKATIPDRADQHANRTRKGSTGGRPPAFDTAIYRRRNVVERCIGHLKKWRGIAMRTDKTARNYHAGITLAATLLWLTLN
jgi:transposase